MKGQTWPLLVVYHPKTGSLDVTQYDEFRDACADCLRLERERTDPEIEIVVIRSDSLESLKLSHSRYFMGGKVRTHA